MRLPAAMTLVLLLPSARAADSLWLAGTSGSPLGTYSYVGALFPLGEGTLGQGWIMRQWIDRLTYHYNGFEPDIHALDYGYSPAIGYQWTLQQSHHAALYVGVRVANTELTPDDPSNVDRGTRARLTLQGDLTSDFSAGLQNQFLAAGEAGNGAYFVRDRLLWRLGAHISLGPEAIAQGNRQYRAHEVGVCLSGIPFTRHISALLRAGVYQQHDQPTVGQVGLELAGTL